MAIDQMPRCRDCRWWDMRSESAIGDPDEPGIVPTIDGACRRFGFPLALPVAPNHWSYDDDAILGWTSAKAYISGDDDATFFMTEADFGCVQFEPKEPPP